MSRAICPPLGLRARPARAAGALLSLWSALGCAPAARPPASGLDAELSAMLERPVQGMNLHLPTQATWREGRRRLAALRREAQGRGPRTLRVQLALREPRTGRVLEARGAVAIAPPAGPRPDPATGALRMILLGPGGTTALDLWARGDRFRFAVPAIDLLRRGDASTPRAALRGMPVEFLRWWLLRPAEGTLLWYERAGAADAFVLRDGDAIVDLRVRGNRIGARRATWARAEGRGTRLLDEELVVAERIGCGEVRYAQASTGLFVTVRCEGEERERAPDPRAFVDPDAPAEGGGS